MQRLVAHDSLASDGVPRCNVLSGGGSILGTSLGVGTGRTNSWFPTLDLLLPVAGLLLSLFLQVVLLITGQLRRRAPGAELPGWVAYVGSDLVAAYTLGLLSRSQQHVGLYGLWAALLVYHLGGPDNFTAYGRADSELWKRHAVNLLIQVGSALHIIYMDSRGWILVPTLLVFLVGCIRYCERTLALMHSSRGGTTEAMTPLYKYMEREGEPSPTGELNYIVAGGNHWYSTMERLSAPTGSFYPHEALSQSKPDLVTTADIEVELDLPDEIAQWAQWLVVASASSSAYLRRVVGLARLEQLTAKGATRLRSEWFGKRLVIEDWMKYMQLEQYFLYSLLYTKATNPDGNLPRFIFRILSSWTLMGSLVAVYFLAGYETWQGYIIYQVATNVVLLVGAVVEFGYVLRLFFSKGAVVAMLVHLVKTRRSQGIEVLFTVEQYICVWLLRINKWWETTTVMDNKIYVPGSHWEKGRNTQRILYNRIEAYIPSFISENWERGWEMVRMATPAGRDCTTLLQKIEESQSDGVMAVLESIRNLTSLPPSISRRQYMPEPRPEPSWLEWESDTPIPNHSHTITQFCRKSFKGFYSGNWEHVLLVWLIATLKVLCLQERSLSIGVPIGRQYQPKQLLRVAKVCSAFEHEGIQAEANAETTQMEAVWLMLYICHLLTVCPELLPTHLELTKRTVAENMAIARKEICDPCEWVRNTLESDALGHPVSISDVPNVSSLLAVKLMMDQDVVKRWEVVKRSACHFIATLAQTAKLDEHCSKLTQGGELLTALWILSSHLGGGAQN